MKPDPAGSMSLEATGCGQHGIVANVFERVSAVAGDDVRALLGELQKCMRCGQCRASCPVFATSGSETDVARGKLALLLEQLGGNLAPDRELYARLTRCVNCGRCRLECPSGTDTGYVMLEGRRLLQGRIGLPPLKAATIKGVFGRPRVLKAAAAALRLVQPLFFRASPVDPRHVRSIWRLPLFGQRMLLPSLRRRHPVSAPKPNPYLDSNPNSQTAPATTASGAPVVIYPGCLVDLGYPELLTAAREVFARLRRPVIIPEGLVCCGAPATYAGDADTARRLGAANIRAVAPHLTAPGARLAFLCPSCAVAFKHDYPAYLFGRLGGGRDALADAGLSMDTVRDIASKSVDAIQLAWQSGAGEHLAAAGRVGAGAGAGAGAGGNGSNGHGAGNGGLIGGTVTYHDPCHLRRLLGVHAEPRAALRALCGAGYREAPRPDGCCGFGGTFALDHIGASSEMLELRARELASTGAGMVATACPGCMAWIANGVDRIGSAQRAVHLIELLAAGLGATGTAAG